jgi:hypothetical protein
MARARAIPPGHAGGRRAAPGIGGQRPRLAPARAVPPGQSDGDRAVQRHGRRRAARAAAQRAEPLETLGSRRAPIVSRIPREGTQPPLRASSKTSRHIDHHWRGDWRSDHRYNWREHRRRHRSLFRFGFYVDPFGWRYRPYSIGWRMWPSYYRSSYWLNDPWRYRLPYAPPGYRWIRYYDDLVLVDTWDGRVADVIYDFFW